METKKILGDLARGAGHIAKEAVVRGARYAKEQRRKAKERREAERKAFEDHKLSIRKKICEIANHYKKHKPGLFSGSDRYVIITITDEVFRGKGLDNDWRQDISTDSIGKGGQRKVKFLENDVTVYDRQCIVSGGIPKNGNKITLCVSKSDEQSITFKAGELVDIRIGSTPPDEFDSSEN